MIAGHQDYDAHMVEFAVIILAGFAAGVVNSIAGGGSFLTFPALVWVGLPPIAANATSTLAVLPGYFSAAMGFRDDLQRIGRAHLRNSVLVALAGGLTGGILLLVSPAQLFAAVVPFLLLAATLAFAFQKSILGYIQRNNITIHPFGLAGLAAVSTYGGYFNGGLGIILLALFSLWGMTDISAMNGLKSVLSVVISAISALAFAIAGLIHWPEVAAMAVAAVAGGYSGARVSRILPARVVRVFIVCIGFFLAVVFFVRL